MADVSEQGVHTYGAEVYLPVWMEGTSPLTLAFKVERQRKKDKTKAWAFRWALMPFIWVMRLAEIGIKGKPEAIFVLPFSLACAFPRGHFT